MVELLSHLSTVLAAHGCLGFILLLSNMVAVFLSRDMRCRDSINSISIGSQSPLHVIQGGRPEYYGETTLGGTFELASHWIIHSQYLTIIEWNWEQRDRRGANVCRGTTYIPFNNTTRTFKATGSSSEHGWEKGARQ